jgi:hypothetical protein
MKKESAALFEHAEEFNFTAHVSLSGLGNINDERVEIRVHVRTAFAANSFFLRIGKSRWQRSVS